MKQLLIDGKDREDTVWLCISSWRGMSIGAVHYYGRFQPGTKPGEKYTEIDLEHPMSAKEAERLNFLHNQGKEKIIFCYEEGEMTQGFDSRQDVIDRAIAIWRDEFPNHKRLVLGDSGYYEPQDVLDER